MLITIFRMILHIKSYKKLYYIYVKSVFIIRMSLTITHNIPTKKLFEEWNVREFKVKFHIEISKKDVFELSFDFNICYEWSR